MIAIFKMANQFLSVSFCSTAHFTPSYRFTLKVIQMAGRGSRGSRGGRGRNKSDLYQKFREMVSQYGSQFGHAMGKSTLSPVI